MFDVSWETCFSRKIYTAALDIGLQQWDWVERTVHDVEIHGHSDKRKVFSPEVSKKWSGGQFSGRWKDPSALISLIKMRLQTVLPTVKTLIHRNILPTDPNKKIKLICYKFKTSNLVIRNNSSPSIGVLQKTNVIYKFKCPLGDCISDDDTIYQPLRSGRIWHTVNF